MHHYSVSVQTRRVAWLCLILLMSLGYSHTWAATVVATFSKDGVPLKCNHIPFQLNGKNLFETVPILGLALNLDVPTGDGGIRTDKASFRLIGIVKEMDSCTPLLMEAAAGKQRLQITVSYWELDQIGRLRENTRISMDNVIIDNIEESSQSSDAEEWQFKMREQITVRADVVTVEDFVQQTIFSLDNTALY